MELEDIKTVKTDDVTSSSNIEDKLSDVIIPSEGMNDKKLKELLEQSTIQTFRDIKNIDEPVTKVNQMGWEIRLPEGIILRGWKLIDDISTRVLRFNSEIVLLECLIDREEGIYEEREYKASYFSGYELIVGKLFKLSFYERLNQVMMEVNGSPGLVLESDFPKIDFFKEFGNSKLFKKS